MSHSVACSTVMSRAERAPGGDAVEEAADERRGEADDRLGPAAEPGDRGRRALPLERLVPRLGPHRFGVAQQALDDPVGRVGVVVDLGFEVLGDGGRPTDEHLPDQLVLVGDVAVDGRPRAAGPPGDLVDPHGQRAVLGDDLGGGGEQPRPQLACPRLAAMLTLLRCLRQIEYLSHRGCGMDRYTVISADCHGGGAIADYRPYLPSTAPRATSTRGAPTFENPYDDLGATTADRNWDCDRRLAELEADGVVAEVIFPNTIPPFFPQAVARAPAAGRRRRRPRRCAGPGCRPTTAGWPTSARGARAGGPASPRSCCTTSTPRWPRSLGGRRRAHRRRAAARARRPGSGLPPLYAPDYEPLWRVCEELGMPVNHHSGSAVARLRRLPRGQGDVPARGHLVGAPGAVAAHLLRRDGAPPDAAVRVHRAGHGVAPRAARHASTTTADRMSRRGRLAGARRGAPR